MEFDLQPRLSLLSFDVETPVKYQVKQGPVTVPMPQYETYNIELKNLDMKLVSDYTGLVVPFANIDRNRGVIVI